MKHTSYYWRVIFAILILLLLSGCEDPNRAAAIERIAQAEQRLDTLRGALENGGVRNAALIERYARSIKGEQPGMSAIADLMRKDSSTEGALFKHLQTRLNEVKRMQQVHSEPKALLMESESLLRAMAIPAYNSALTDTVNALADMSGGTLPRINAMSKDEEALINDASDYGTGSQLVGNPAYGQWSQSSGGTSFWEWYGMYSLFSNLAGGGRSILYNDWDRHRPYSHYQDRGVHQYGSQKGRERASSYQKSNTKSYQSSARKGSTYAKGSGVKARNTSGYVASKSMGQYGGSSKSSAYGSSGSKGSSYGSGSKSSSYGGSFRGSSSSRSFGGGGK
ncbi:MAG: hypothetical protein L3J62_04935 [Gammaproteobacteria bacterium]|nr:hypothetical protein [Gammaproteobacteria bacterium]MCF6230131.1 hypothetical protein [Gammaproteobacteria bacterium]